MPSTDVDVEMVGPGGPDPDQIEIARLLHAKVKARRKAREQAQTKLKQASLSWARSAGRARLMAELAKPGAKAKIKSDWLKLKNNAAIAGARPRPRSTRPRGRRAGTPAASAARGS